MFGLGACFIVEGPQPEQPVRQKPVVSVENPVYVEGGSASDNLDYFIYTLQDFSESEVEIKGANLVAALETAGFNRADMQVTYDLSKTNIPLDSITTSVRFENECLLGQVETKTREFYVSIAETVGPEKDLCLIGNTAEI